MENSRLNTKEEKGIIIKMSSTKKTKKKNEKQGMDDNYVVPKSTVRILTAVVTTTCTLVIGALSWLCIQTINTKSTIAQNSTTISALKKDMDSVESDIDKINKTLNGDGSVENPGLVARVYAMEKLQPVIADSDIIASVDTASKEANDVSIVGSSMTADTCLGTDANGNVILAGDMIDQTIFLTYTDEGKEIYFLGQYNEDYKWNGRCVTNAYYEDGTLYGMCESNFDNGKRLDYKSFVRDEGNTWIYSDKVCVDKKNSGINVRYSLNYDKVKDFTHSNARVSDFLYADDFVTRMHPVMTTYYSGDTVDGKYNDNSGKAYEIKYDEDGAVTLLYVGQFKNGTFNDSTGNAWEIVYAEQYGYYIHNTGNFRDGHADNPSKTIVNINEIEQIISDYDFVNELKWKCE